MKGLGFPNQDCIYVSKMVRYHGFYFQPDVSEKVLKDFLCELGRGKWADLIDLRKADRAGNLAKKDRPLITEEMTRLLLAIYKLEVKYPKELYKEDLALSGEEFITLGAGHNKLTNEMYANIFTLIEKDPSKNTKEWLTEYVKTRYSTRLKQLSILRSNKNP